MQNASSRISVMALSYTCTDNLNASTYANCILKQKNCKAASTLLHTTQILSNIGQIQEAILHDKVEGEFVELAITMLESLVRDIQLTAPVHTRVCVPLICM